VTEADVRRIAREEADRSVMAVLIQFVVGFAVLMFFWWMGW
jgi:hypothetical protein